MNVLALISLSGLLHWIVVPIIIGIICWAIWKIVALLPLHPLVRQVIEIILVVALVIVLLEYVLIPLIGML